MNTQQLVAHIEAQITTRGLDPLSAEQIALLESENRADREERDWLLEDLSERVGLDVPADAFSCVDDDERSNGPRR